MFRLRLPQIALALTLAVTGTTQAAELVAQPPQTASLNGLQADNSTGAFAQTFSAPALSVVESISWWGFHGSNSAGPAFDDFAVYFDGSLQAGTLSSAPVDLGDLSVLTRYTLDVTDAPLTATTLEIVNNSLDVEWFWQYSSFNGSNTEDLAFVLTGSLVPEPSTYLLFLVGIAAVAAASRLGRES